MTDWALIPSKTTDKIRAALDQATASRYDHVPLITAHEATAVVRPFVVKLEQERDRLTEALSVKNGTKLTQSRLWDLVRYQRSALLKDELITRKEYAALLIDETRDTPGQGSPSPRRLEEYDRIKADAALGHAVRELRAAIEEESDCNCAEAAGVCAKLLAAIDKDSK